MHLITPRSRYRRAAAAALFVATALGLRTLDAQAPAALTADREAFADWLAHAPTSPTRAIGLSPLGAAAAAVDTGGGSTQVIERDGVVRMVGTTRALPRNRPVRIGKVTALVTGTPGRSQVLLFAAADRAPTKPTYYDYDPALVFVGTLTPPSTPGSDRVLTADGVEVDATDAGSVVIDLGRPTRLRVLRLPDPGSEESTLEIYFRDATSGAGSYPAGRFVTLQPIDGGRYRLDFNRARNPFCSYNPAYPCPAPWHGNTIPAPVRAGEQYVGH